jgi:hypothetical protein
MSLRAVCKKTSICLWLPFIPKPYRRLVLLGQPYNKISFGASMMPYSIALGS